MTAFFTAFLMVFLAELGDKTQLLVMAFAAKYRWQTVMLAVLIATVANHLVAIIIGIYVNTVINMDYIHLAAAATFFIFCIGTLISNDREEKLKDKRMLINPFWTVAVAFFLAETGDKTQLATIAMAARFGEWLPLLIGTTAGMIAADGLGYWPARSLTAMCHKNEFRCSRPFSSLFAESRSWLSFFTSSIFHKFDL